MIWKRVSRLLENSLMDEVIKPRAQLKPCSLKYPISVHPVPDWDRCTLSTDRSLFKFIAVSAYLPVYLRQTTNDITGEHSAIMLKSLAGMPVCGFKWIWWEFKLSFRCPLRGASFKTSHFVSKTEPTGDDSD